MASVEMSQQQIEDLEKQLNHEKRMMRIIVKASVIAVLSIVVYISDAVVPALIASILTIIAAIYENF